MNTRVFNIGRECFVIFSDELNNRKEKFSLIGNSEKINDLDSDVKFVRLLSNYYPGDPFRYNDTPERISKIIGLNANLKSYVSYSQNSRLLDSPIQIIVADNNDAGITERKFIKKIENDVIKKRHSFASFYKDGNVRIFNKNELFF